MNSMTGFAYKEVNFEDVAVTVEIKSYNSRFLDLNVFMPSFLSRLESKVRECIARKIARGKVEVNIKIKEKSPKMDISVDIEAAKKYADIFKKVLAAIDSAEKVPLSLVVSQEGVLSSQRETDLDWYESKFFPVLEDALDTFCSDRKREGENLYNDITSMLSKIEASVSVFKKWMAEMEEQFKNNIRKRFNDILGDQVDEQKVLSETAVLLVKYTINEEVVRLESHINAFKDELKNNPLPGRKIDFICQEMNREINTIGSKNQIYEVGQAVIEAKDALENIREQSRNVE